jgi:hypothetical protein
MCAIAGNDDELANHLRLVVLPFRRHAAVSWLLRGRSLRQEPREQGPRRAPARWARRRANTKALLAIETQRELSQGKMRCRSEHSSTAGHRRVTSGTGRGVSEPVLATVWPGLGDANCTAASRVRRARSCHRDNQRAVSDGADDRRTAVRISARTPAPGGGRARSRCAESAGRPPMASGPATASSSPPSAARRPACGAARAPRAC